MWYLSRVGRGGAGHGHRVHHVLLDVGDGWSRGHTGHALSERGVTQGCGHGSDWSRADTVLHVKSNQPFPRQNIIVQTIEQVNLQQINNKTMIDNNKHVPKMHVDNLLPF